MSIHTTAVSDPSTRVQEPSRDSPQTGRAGQEVDRTAGASDPLELIKLVASENRAELRDLVHSLPRDDVDELLVRLVGDWDDLAAQLFDYEETADAR